MSSPKTLAERLDWMAKHIPGFREEREAAYFAQREARAPDALVVGQIVSQVTSINCAI